MFNQPRLQSALLSTLVVLLLILLNAGAPDASVSQATTASTTGGGPSPAATARCADPITPFNANNFPNPPKTDNTNYSLVPGTQFIMEGRANRTGAPLPHQVIFTVTDLTKVINGVRTVVLWDQDINDGVLVEAELAFHAQDNAKNVWVLGEYPEEYVGGQFDGAPSTWFSGQANVQGGALAQGGTLVPGNPQLNTPKFLQAYASPDIINDCGQVSAMGQQVCNSIGCYDNVLVINETSPLDPPGSIQQKFYAPGVGNFQIGALNDPEGETLVLKQIVHLSLEACVAARNNALALEQHAYQVNNPPNLYANTAPMEHTATCAATPPTATPTVTTTPLTATPPTTTPGHSSFLPFTSKPMPTPTLLPTPTLPPAIFDGCKSDPNPASAPNFPVRIVSVNKVTEVVTLQNVSNATVSVEDWNMCSINGNQEHDQIFGILAPGQTRTFPNTGTGSIWDDNTRDDGALYNAGGFLVSYWVNQ